MGISLKIQTYFRDGTKDHLIEGTILGTYGDRIRLSDGRVLQAADVKPADDSPDVTAYIEVRE